jgi:UDP-N-acetyl-D-glucosamine dehydrogenase
LANPLLASAAHSEILAGAIASKTAVIGICGLGYVGLPLAMAARKAKFRVVGFDTDPTKVEALNAGRSHLGTVRSEVVRRAVQRAMFEAT